MKSNFIRCPFLYAVQIYTLSKFIRCPNLYAVQFYTLSKFIRCPNLYAVQIYTLFVFSTASSCSCSLVCPCSQTHALSGVPWTGRSCIQHKSSHSWHRIGLLFSSSQSSTRSGSNSVQSFEYLKQNKHVPSLHTRGFS